jgi:serine/threonine protein kinase
MAREQAYCINMGPMGFAKSDHCQITVLRGHAQITINVNIARVQNTPFGKEILQKIISCGGHCFGIDDTPKKPFGLVYQHCLTLLTSLAPETSLQDLSLECFLHAPTYCLELGDAGNGKDVRIEGANQCSYTPSFSMSPMRTANLPSLCKALPHLRADTLRISPILETGKSLDTVQGRVITADGVAMYFKPRHDMREPEFERELRVLSQIDQAGLTKRLRVPQLLGIVVSGDAGEVTMGMLMTLITSPAMGSHLQSPGFHDKPELHEKWGRQVTAIIQELHAHDIVWGDVNPMNVVIDEAMDAWVIDFGGMNNVEFVDEEKRETAEGDWQGVGRLFGSWLPRRCEEQKAKSGQDM